MTALGQINPATPDNLIYYTGLTNTLITNTADLLANSQDMNDNFTATNSKINVVKD